MEFSFFLLMPDDDDDDDDDDDTCGRNSLCITVCIKSWQTKCCCCRLMYTSLGPTYFVTDPRGSDHVPKSLQMLKMLGVYQEIRHV
jgi:hypothetical protein